MFILIWSKVSIFYTIYFLRNSNNKYNFVAIYVPWQITVAPQLKKYVNQSSLPLYQLYREINMNEHQNVSCFNQKHCFFKFKSSNVNLLSCLVCLSDKNGIMIGQIAC